MLNTKFKINVGYNSKGDLEIGVRDPEALSTQASPSKFSEPNYLSTTKASDIGTYLMNKDIENISLKTNGATNPAARKAFYDVLKISGQDNITKTLNEFNTNHSEIFNGCEFEANSMQFGATQADSQSSSFTPGRR